MAPSEWSHPSSKVQASVWCSVSCCGLCTYQRGFPTDKDDFYQTLESAMLLTKSNDLVMCLGDFSAVMGPGTWHLVLTGHLSWQAIWEWFTEWQQQQLQPTPTDLSASVRVHSSWLQVLGFGERTYTALRGFPMMAGEERRSTIYLLFSRRWSAVINCRVYRKLEFDTDHRAVVRTFRLRLKKCSLKPPPRKWYDLIRLRDSSLDIAKWLRYSIVLLRSRMRKLTHGICSNRSILA